MKKKKIITSLAGVAAVAIPVVAVTACTEADGNRRIQSPNGLTASEVGQVWAKCGDIKSQFQCYDNGEARLIGVKDENGDLVIPATVSLNEVEYKVTELWYLGNSNHVCGLDFSKATNLRTIAAHALEHWDLTGNRCNWDFSNTKLETIGEKAFDNAMSAYLIDENQVDLIKFPKTIKSIGEEAFGQDSKYDPKVRTIGFSTRDVNDIKNIKFGKNWQPHSEDNACLVRLPKEELIDVYNGVENFNPHGYKIGISDLLVKCGDVHAWFICNDSDNTATLYDCENEHDILVIPATVINDGVTYAVTKIAKLDVRKKVDGVDFSQATNLKEIEGHAFEHWYLIGPESKCNFDFSNTKLEKIGEKAFDNAMKKGCQKVVQIKFPSTIKSIGWEAFGQTGECDIKAKQIFFTATDENTIKGIYFGSGWEPNDWFEHGKHSTVYVPRGTYGYYASVENFNPRGYPVVEYDL